MSRSHILDNIPTKSVVPTPIQGIPAAPRVHTNMSERGTYRSSWAPIRPGADDGLAVPSRIGNRLHYRDGRAEVVA
jgi:hypothetical protein